MLPQTHFILVLLPVLAAGAFVPLFDTPHRGTESVASYSSTDTLHEEHASSQEAVVLNMHFEQVRQSTGISWPMSAPKISSFDLINDMINDPQRYFPTSSSSKSRTSRRSSVDSSSSSEGHSGSDSSSSSSGIFFSSNRSHGRSKITTRSRDPIANVVKTLRQRLISSGMEDIRVERLMGMVTPLMHPLKPFTEKSTFTRSLDEAVAKSPEVREAKRLWVKGTGHEMTAYVKGALDRAQDVLLRIEPSIFSSADAPEKEIYLNPFLAVTDKGMQDLRRRLPQSMVLAALRLPAVDTFIGKMWTDMTRVWKQLVIATTSLFLQGRQKKERMESLRKIKEVAIFFRMQWEFALEMAEMLAKKMRDGKRTLAGMQERLKQLAKEMESGRFDSSGMEVLNEICEKLSTIRMEQKELISQLREMAEWWRELTWGWRRMCERMVREGKVISVREITRLDMDSHIYTLEMNHGIGQKLMEMYKMACDALNKDTDKVLRELETLEEGTWSRVRKAYRRSGQKRSLQGIGVQGSLEEAGWGEDAEAWRVIVRPPKIMGRAQKGGIVWQGSFEVVQMMLETQSAVATLLAGKVKGAVVPVGVLQLWVTFRLEEMLLSIREVTEEEKVKLRKMVSETEMQKMEEAQTQIGPMLAPFIWKYEVDLFQNYLLGKAKEGERLPSWDQKDWDTLVMDAGVSGVDRPIIKGHVLWKLIASTRKEHAFDRKKTMAHHRSPSPKRA